MTINPDDLSPGPAGRPGNLDDDGGYLWVLTEPTMDGSYTITIQFNQDRTRSLNPDQAVDWAKGFLAAAARAEYDVAVVRQLTKRLGIPIPMAVQTVNSLRKDRPELTGIDPLVLEAGVAMDGDMENAKFRAFVAMYLEGEQYGQTDVEGAREHARVVLEAIEVANLDAGYRRELVGVIGVKESIAGNVISDLGNYR